MLDLVLGALLVVLLLLGYAHALRLRRYLTWLHLNDVNPERLLHSYVTRSLVLQPWYLPVLCWMSFGRMRSDLHAYRRRIEHMNFQASFDEPIALKEHYEFHRTSFFRSGYRYIQINQEELVIGNSIPILWQQLEAIEVRCEGGNSNNHSIWIKEKGKPSYNVVIDAVEVNYVTFELILKKMLACYGKEHPVEVTNPSD